MCRLWPVALGVFVVLDADAASCILGSIVNVKVAGYIPEVA